MKCNNCGATLERTASFCGYCGTTLTPEAPAGSAVQPAQFAAAVPMPAGGGAAAAMAPTVAPVAAPVSDLPEYYRNVFAAIDAGGSGASKWNWAAALCGALWYIYRGLWAKALLLVTVSVVSGGVANLILFFYMGKMGNYDLWLLRRQGKQMW
jgi:hypothetical protein